MPLTLIKVDILRYDDKKYVDLSSLTNLLAEYLKVLEDGDCVVASAAVSYILSSVLEWQAR